MKPRDVLAIVGTCALALSVYPVVRLLAGTDRLHLVSMCPVMDGHVTLVVATTENGERGPSHDVELIGFDLATGTRTAHVGLPGFREDAHRTLCLGAARHGTVWLRHGAEHALEMRDARTGALVVSSETILARNPGLGVGVVDVGWDATTSAPTLSLRDGRNVRLDAATLATTRFEGSVSMTSLGSRRDAVVQTAAVGYYVGGLDGLVLADGRRVTLAGHPRAALVIDGERLFGERDFYMPAMLSYPASGRIEWPDPPSLVIVEETLVGSLRYKVTRIGLDGRVQFTYDPGESLPATWIYRPTPWTSALGGRRLVHFGADGIIGLDARTGRELYRTGYGGEPMTR